ncbi:MAG: protein kinase [Acidobacteriota bacterium]
MFRDEILAVPTREAAVSHAPREKDPRVGRYQILEKIGEGAMGVVYRALDPAIQRVVAIKMMSAGLDDDPTMRERFFREARSAGQLSHRNIVTIYELGEEQGRAYIVMEFIEGETLRYRLARRHAMPLDEKLRIMIEVCMGVAHAHSKDVIHRDLKPDNMFIAKDGSVKLLDFGLARGSTSDMTKAGTVMGTPSYMSPEQVKGLNVDGRSDIFSMGAVFYELLAARKPFQAPSYAATFYKILNEEPEPIETADPSVPVELSRIVARALRKSPEERYRTSDELLSALTEFRRIRQEALAEQRIASRTASTLTAASARPDERRGAVEASQRAVEHVQMAVRRPEPPVEPCTTAELEQEEVTRPGAIASADSRAGGSGRVGSLQQTPSHRTAVGTAASIDTDALRPAQTPIPRTVLDPDAGIDTDALRPPQRPAPTTPIPRDATDRPAVKSNEDARQAQSMPGTEPLHPRLPQSRLVLIAAVLLALGAGALALLFLAPEKAPAGPSASTPAPAAGAPSDAIINPPSTRAVSNAASSSSSPAAQTKAPGGMGGPTAREAKGSQEVADRIATGKRDAAALLAQRRHAEAFGAVSAVLKADPSDAEAKALLARVTGELRASADAAMKQAGTARARAEAAGAAVAAEDLFSRSRAGEEQARRFYDSGDFARAAETYQAAAGTYIQAAEASSRVTKPVGSPGKGAVPSEHVAPAAPVPPPVRSESPPIPASNGPPAAAPSAAPPVGLNASQPQPSQSPALDRGDEREEVNQMLQRYARALERKDMGLVLSIWPTLGAAEQRRIQESFKFTRAHDVTISIVAAQLDGGTGTVTCDRVDEIVTTDGQKVPPNRSRPTFVVRKTADGWTIVSVR